MKILRIFQSVFGNTCPSCHKGKVFSCGNPFNLRRMFDMEPTCSHCGLKYEKEPGFFYGAMYVAYALTSGWITICYISNELWLHLDAWFLISFTLISLVVLAPLTLRASRLIWLNFFVSYEEDAKTEKQ